MWLRYNKYINTDPLLLCPELSGDKKCARSESETVDVKIVFYKCRHLEQRCCRPHSSSGCGTSILDLSLLSITWIKKREFHFVFLLDPRMSDPGDGVQAQLWRASSCTHGFREVSHAHVYSIRTRIRRPEIFPRVRLFGESSPAAVIFFVVCFAGSSLCVTAWCISSWQRGCCTGCCSTRTRSSLWSRAPAQEELLPTRRRRKRTWDWEDWVGNSCENCRTWWASCRAAPTAASAVLNALNACCCVVAQRLIEEENMLAPSLQQFSLRTEMLPSYIPIRVAEKILFVGESVQMFENHTHGPSRAGNLVWH